MTNQNIFSKKTILLILIFIIGIFLRFWQINKVPPSPSLDEVSLGWNSYSIYKTGADEYGAKFPLLLRAYDDWRPALYAYAVAPFISMFGLSPLAVKIPSLISSLIILYLTYLTCRLISSQIKINKTNSNEIFPLVATLLVAISPWQIYLSRLGHEANFGLCFSVLGIYFFLKSQIIKGKYDLIISAIFFVIALYSYQSQKVILPVTLLGLAIIYFNNLIKSKIQTISAIILALVLLIPLFRVTFSETGMKRFAGTSAFLYDPQIQQAQAKFADARKKGFIITRLIYSPKTIGITIFISKYISHFNPKWLFFGGPQEAHKAPYSGLLNLIELPLIIFGIYFLIKVKFDLKLKGVIWLWLLTAPLAASLTTGTPHAMRSYTFIPVWQIIGAFGFWQILFLIENNKIRNIIVVIFLILCGFTVANFYHNYYLEFPKLQSKSFQYALNNALPYVINNEAKYNKIIVSNNVKNNMLQSYMFYLFHVKYDPVIYQKSGGTISGGYDQDHQIGKYEFRAINYEKDKLFRNTLIVADPQDLPESAPVFLTFKYLDGSVGIKLMKTEEK